MSARSVRVATAVLEPGETVDVAAEGSATRPTSLSHEVASAAGIAVITAIASAGTFTAVRRSRSFTIALTNRRLLLLSVSGVKRLKIRIVAKLDRSGLGARRTRSFPALLSKSYLVVDPVVSPYCGSPSP